MLYIPSCQKVNPGQYIQAIFTLELQMPYTDTTAEGVGYVKCVPWVSAVALLSFATVSHKLCRIRHVPRVR